MAAMKMKSHQQQDDSCNSVVRLIVLLYLVVIFIIGLGLIGTGIWMEVDPYVKSYFIVLQRSVTDEVLMAAPPILITSGLVALILGGLGCFGMMKSNKLIFGIFAFFLTITLIMMFTIGFSVVKFDDDIHKRLKDGMKEQLQDEYMFDNEVGKAWNHIQVRHKCCGADDSYDYYGSKWFYSENDGYGEGLEDATVFCPETCCVLDFNQDRDPSHVNPQDPKPKDPQRCQEDAEGRKDGSQYLHGRGCYSRLIQDFIYHHVDAIIGVGIAVGIFALLGFCGVIYLLRNME